MYVTIILGIVLLQYVSCGDWIINLEYSLGSWENVSPLGKIALRPSFDGNFSGSFLVDAKSVNLGSQMEKSTSSIYRIRATSNDKVKSNFTTFTKPCMMMKAKLMHLFWVAVDSERQMITSLTVFPDNVFAGSNLNSEEVECSEFSVEDVTPHGTVHVHSMRHLPVPDTQTFVDKIERERKARIDGGEGGQDNRSFLAKYWMYIVPVVIFMLISSAVNPDQGS